MEEGDFRHPNWRASRRKLEQQFEREMWSEYSEGRLSRSITHRNGRPRIDVAGAIRRAAYDKAVVVVAATANQYEENRAASKRKTGEAA